ncbi:DinB family protein [Pseudoalteromonas sp. OOF1S-7]|uniref:DinB family protein n=1 Tax=Pseudoalteromonas sp. OOF1S-7 TaxID=2917757 RepID=UPI001EF45FA5|nr:DinB family protein [Pseudoalteromonas sp. OOF1S-7]MCG7535238.1 DinB family protein [Pseudoalteromonas sp. OOF1S-7]
MSQLTQFRLLADYNQWMNQKLYTAAAQLSDAALKQDRGAFFGSILGTLNHLVVADLIWLKRYAACEACAGALAAVVAQPGPTSLDQCLFHDLAQLTDYRQWLDAQILGLLQDLQDSDLTSILTYRNSQGVTYHKPFASLLVHFFNHQTHHRGQVSTLLCQAGEDIGATDLVLLIDDIVP